MGTVIATEAKQSSFLACCTMDCFASLAMTSKHDFAISPRVSREVWPARSALLIRGRRECRAPDAPDSRVCDGRKQRAHALVRSHRNHPAFPAQWFYGLCRTLPGDRAFLSPSPAEIASRKLDASVEASGPHDFAVRTQSALVRSAACGHRIQPRVRDDRDTPLKWGGRRRI